MLHVTNGDEAAGRLREAGISGTILPWRDPLHVGPVPAGLALEELSAVRARFFAGCPFGRTAPEVLDEFRQRDVALRAFKRHDEIVLWFEHDLVDQLQVLQVLGWFATRDRTSIRLSLLSIDSHPSVARFEGLGQLAPEALAALFPTRREVTADQLDLARRTWDAFTANQPTAIRALVDGDTAALPFLRGALLRLLEEFPSTEDGLSRTERQILAALDRGILRARALFDAVGDTEEHRFLGDWLFFLDLAGLGTGAAPLVTLAAGHDFAHARPTDETFWDSDLRLTADGRRVLERKAMRFDLIPLDRWIGGVRLEGRVAPWRFNPRTRALVAR